MLFLLFACSSSPTRLTDISAQEAWLEGADFTTGAVVGGVVAGDAVLFVRDGQGEVVGERVALSGPVLALGLEVNVDPEWGGAVPLQLPQASLPAEQLLGTYRGPAEAFGVGVGVSARQLCNRHGVSFDESHLAFGVGLMVALEWLRLAPGGSEDLSDNWDFSFRMVDTGPEESPPDDGAPDDSTTDDSNTDDSTTDDSTTDDSRPSESRPADTASDRSSAGCGCAGPMGDSSGDDTASGGSGGSSSGCDGSAGSSDSWESSGSSGSSGCSSSTSGSSGCGDALSCDGGGSLSCTSSPARGGLLAFVLSIAAVRRRR